ncbi:Protein of unknown function (DUF420) [Candidatus Kryptonium thompsonii]|nr:Protein of unknown function (DUF420) [Candidatus Kryptonium thompsoni]
MIKILPNINAIFNLLSLLFLSLGFLSIRRKHVKRHKIFMLSAFVSSTLFLISYLVYHYNAGVTRFLDLFFDFIISHFPCRACSSDGCNYIDSCTAWEV